MTISSEEREAIKQIKALARAVKHRCEFCVSTDKCNKPGECTGWQFDYDRFAVEATYERMEEE